MNDINKLGHNELRSLHSRLFDLIFNTGFSMQKAFQTRKMFSLSPWLTLGDQFMDQPETLPLLK
jgi:hypothetical protein